MTLSPLVIRLSNDLFFMHLKQSLCMVGIVLSLLHTVHSQSNLAQAFMEGQPSQKPVLFRFSTLNGERELIIKEPSEVNALAVVFQRSDTGLRLMNAFDMEITFAGGEKVSYRIYTARAEQMGFVVTYPVDDGTGDPRVKNVRIDSKEIPESLLNKLSTFGLLPKQLP